MTKPTYHTKRAKQARYPSATFPLLISLLVALCVTLWRKWRASDVALRATLSEIARRL